MRLPHGYTNETERAGGAVRKRYLGRDALERFNAEKRALERLQGVLPVPRLISADASAVELSTTFVDGEHGQDLIARGRGDAVLVSLGRVLREIVSLPSGVVAAAADGEGSHLVHGDFGPQNAIFNPATAEVAALVDWEWCRRGDPVADLAWAEWIVRMHHSNDAVNVGSLFDGYGERPSWEARHRAMVARCEELLRAAETDAGCELWRERLAATEQFDAVR